jgi:hypothetical protein
MRGEILLRAPLVEKLVGANVLVAAAALLATLADGAAIGRVHVAARLLVALAVALVLNLGLVVLALRPLRTIQQSPRAPVAAKMTAVPLMEDVRSLAHDLHPRQHEVV